MKLRVKQLPPDGWCRPRLKNVDTGAIYADVSLGYERYQPVKFNIPGDWHTTSPEGEPSFRLRPDVEFEIVKEESGQ